MGPSAAFLITLLLLSAASSVALAQAPSDLPPPPPPPPGSQPAPPLARAPASPAAAAPAAPSRAEAPPPDEAPVGAWKPMMRAGAGVEIYWFSAKNLGSTFPIIPYAMFDLSPNLLFDLHVPFSLATNTQLGNTNDSKAGIGVGNPTVGLTYVTTNARTTWFIGGRISAPLAGVSDSAPWQIANTLGAVSMALYDLHYWAYKYVPIGLRGGVEWQASPGLFLRGSFEPTLFVPTEDKASIVSTRKALFLYQLRFELEKHGESGWGGGAAVQIVHAVSEGDAFTKGDNAQAGFEPFGSYESGTTFARLGLLLGVDPPLGFGFDQGKVASLHLNVGSHF
jgi:hypothetical protein